MGIVLDFINDCLLIQNEYMIEGISILIFQHFLPAIFRLNRDKQL